ncbi:sugar 3,4-ketoisomerase [Shewanella baltica]|uniref:sugar 3,4-ketoisomerase n=1 Tax=Shewanella baltica TaxID=62322 RepID=UPI003D79683F
MSLIKLIDLPDLGDERGGLVSIEGTVDLSFEIKRVYFLYNTTSNCARGYHAHKNLKQLAICVNGQCDFILDDGNSRETVKLSSPTKGLLIENMIWREMHNFSHDCVLMVLASELYNESDYIRDYSDFLNSKSCNKDTK